MNHDIDNFLNIAPVIESKAKSKLRPTLIDLTKSNDSLSAKSDSSSVDISSKLKKSEKINRIRQLKFTNYKRNKVRVQDLDNPFTHVYEFLRTFNFILLYSPDFKLQSQITLSAFNRPE